MLRKIGIIAATIAVVIGLGYLKVSAIGKPISTDLSIVGQGKPALVLVYENYSPASADALKRLNQVRGDYAARLEFVIADLGVPQGRAFANRYQLANGQVIFLQPGGQPMLATYVPEIEGDLRSYLDAKLASVESTL